MGKDLNSIIMVTLIKETSGREKLKEKAFTNGQTEKSMMVSGKAV